MMTEQPSVQLPNWHSTFAAAPDVASATVRARGTLDLFTVDLLQGAIDVLTATGQVDIVLDLTDVDSVDRAAAWCIAETSSSLASRHGQLAVTNAREAVRAVLGDVHCTLPSNRARAPAQTSTWPERHSERDHEADSPDAEASDSMGGPDRCPTESKSSRARASNQV